MTNKGDNEMMPELKTCPECDSGEVNFCNISVRPYCNECKHWGAINYGSKEDAIKAWNTRTEISDFHLLVEQTWTENLERTIADKDRAIKKLEGVIEEYMYAWDLMRIGHPDAAGLMHKAHDNAKQIKEAKDNG